MTRFKRVGAAAFAAAALSIGVLVAPAASSPVVTGGLVNVTITNLLNNNTVTVQIPVGIGLNLAANVCGVNVGVLAQDLNSGPVSCSTATQSVDITQVL
jgi:hypothetical protein